MDWDSLFAPINLVAIAAFVLGVIAKSLIGRGIDFYFSRNFEKFKNAIKAEDDRLATLRNAAMSQLGTRTAALDKRRLDAAERLWASVVEYGPYKAACKMTKVLKLDEMLKEASSQTTEGEKVRHFAERLWKMWHLETFKITHPPDKERPFLSPLAWAKFAAYRSALTITSVKLAAIMNGVSPSLIADPAPLLTAVKEAFPTWKTFIDEHKTDGFPYIADDMEEDLLREITGSITQSTAHAEHLEIAQKIIAAVNEFATSSNPAPAPPIP